MEGTASHRKRVAVLDDYQSVARELGPWEQLGDRVELTFFHDNLAAEDDVVERLEPFDVVCLMRERTRLPARVLERLPRLKLVVTAAMRNAAVDIDFAVSRGIEVCGTDAVHTGTPELTWLLLLTLARGLPSELESVKSGGWQTHVGVDLHGSTLGIVGLGRVGSRVAKVGQAFGMRVLAWSQNLDAATAASKDATYADKETLFREADFVTLSVQLSARTVGLVGRREFELMKPTAYLINTARSPIVDEPALLDALARKKIAGAALDAFSHEPLPLDHPFRSLDNVILTPHIGYVTAQTYRLFYREMVEDLEAWLNGSPIRRIGSGTALR
ncbi:D-2-hydroxyacid dehydrogenase family protein [soil metagenome]